ncbi:MAG: peptide chain release factor aRF-1, partial [Vulcanisaeta sp.]
GEDEIMNLTLMLKDRKDIELFVMSKSIEENLTLTQTFGGYVAILSSPSWLIENYESEGNSQ